MNFTVNCIPFVSNRTITFRAFRGSIMFMLVGMGLTSPSFAQSKSERPTWWAGLSGGANLNSYKGYTSQLNVDITATPAFGRGKAIGGYFGGFIEYRPQRSLFGGILQFGSDNRRGKFKESGNRLEAMISYFSIEPALMITPQKTGFYAYVGPRLNLLTSTEFTFQAPTGPEYPQEKINPDAYIKNLEKLRAGMHAGVGYNFMISGNYKAKFIIAPFVTYSPSFNQNLRTLERLELNTLRVGIMFKGGLMPTSGLSY